MTLELNLIYEQLEDSWTVNETYLSAIPKYFPGSKNSTHFFSNYSDMEENWLSEDSDMEEDWIFQYHLKCKKTHQRTFNQRVEVIKIMSRLMENPNASGRRGETPIFVAASEGYTEIVKILVLLTDNPNASDNNGKSPINLAAKKGYT